MAGRRLLNIAGDLQSLTIAWRTDLQRCPKRDLSSRVCIGWY